MLSDSALLNQLPPAATDAGILARILLAETVGPAQASFNEAECLEAMQLMQLVVTNRMKAPKRFMAKSGSMRDIVRAPGQFKGFEAYPTIAREQADTILNMLRYRATMESALATAQMKASKAVEFQNKLVPEGTKRDPFQPPPRLFWDLEKERRTWETKGSAFKMEVQQGKAYVAAVLEVCGKPPIADPTPGTLVFWRTSKATKPAPGAILHASRSGNDFYYIEDKL